MSILQLAVLATGFASTAFAQNWVLPVPGQEAKFSEGDVVPLQWSTPYAYTNIQLFQGPQADGDYLYTRLVNASISQNSFTWTAGTLPSASLDRQAFFFRLSNAQEQNGPYVDSANVLIQPAAAAAAQSSALSAAVFATLTASRTTMMTMQTSTVASSGAMSSATGSSSSAASTSGTSAASSGATSSTSGAAAATSPATTSSDGTAAVPSTEPIQTHYTSSFIGVGVGLGVPALLVIAAAAFILIRKRKNDKKAASEATNPEMTQQTPNTPPQV